MSIRIDYNQQNLKKHENNTSCRRNRSTGNQGFWKAECFKEILHSDFSEFESIQDDGSKICVKATVGNGKVTVDFSGTSAQLNNNFNAPGSVAKAAVLYVFRCRVLKPFFFKTHTLHAPTVKARQQLLFQLFLESVTCRLSVHTTHENILTRFVFVSSFLFGVFFAF